MKTTIEGMRIEDFIKKAGENAELQSLRESPNNQFTPTLSYVSRIGEQVHFLNFFVGKLIEKFYDYQIEEDEGGYTITLIDKKSSKKK